MNATFAIRDQPLGDTKHVTNIGHIPRVGDFVVWIFDSYKNKKVTAVVWDYDNNRVYITLE